jgi:hypothetical protein
LIHLGKVNTDATLDRLHLAFERSAGAKCDHRGRGLGTKLYDTGYFLGALRETDRIGRLYRMPGFAVSVLLQY